MTTLYKLTDQDGQTRNDTHWLPLGTEHTATGEGEMCGPGWLHAYTDPLLAVLLNPVHAGLKNPRLFRAQGVIGKTDHGLKVGCTSLKCVREIDVPDISTAQRVRFAILVSLEVYDDPRYVNWARGWLSGDDRSAERAERAARSARSAARAARSAWVAVAAADAAAGVAWAAWSAWVAVADAAAGAAWAADNLDLAALARRAIQEESEATR